MPWKKDKDDKFCGGCGETFGLRRRRHHCRLCGEIRCKQCCRFKTFTDTCVCLCLILVPNSNCLLTADPLLRDCPDYQDLAPPASIPKKKFQMNFLKKGASSVDDDDDLSDEVRMCVPCKKLLERYVCWLANLAV